MKQRNVAKRYAARVDQAQVLAFTKTMKNYPKCL